MKTFFANGSGSHPEGVDVHDEAVDVAAVDPIAIVLGVGAVVIVGFLVWFFILRKK